ncbi:MAG: hypothetical protein QOE63_2022 [Acidimicrobiaceae bacterium]
MSSTPGTGTDQAGWLRRHRERRADRRALRAERRLHENHRWSTADQVQGDMLRKGVNKGGR